MKERPFANPSPTMRCALKQVYRESSRFVYTLPWLVAIPILAELIQHGIEYRSGMYDSLAMARATENDPARALFGYGKELTLFFMGYWVVRFLAFGHDPKRAMALPRRAGLLFVPVLLFEMGLLFLTEAGIKFALTRFAGQLLGVAIFVAWLVLPVCLEIYLICWKTGAALGNGRLSIPTSFRLMHGNFWWSFGLTFLVCSPLMILHYALGLGAIARPAWLTGMLLLADGLFVGYLGVVLIATNYVIASQATAKANVNLIDEELAPPEMSSIPSRCACL